MNMEKEELLLKPMTLVNRRGFLGTKGPNKDVPFYVIDVLVPLQVDDPRSKFFGYDLKNIFLTREQWAEIRPEDIGKVIKFKYEANESCTPVVSEFTFEEYLLRVE